MELPLMPCEASEDRDMGTDLPMWEGLLHESFVVKIMVPLGRRELDTEWIGCSKAVTMRSFP